MAKKTKKRLPKAIRGAEKLRRQAARRHPLGLSSGPGNPDLPPPPWDDADGGAGVREPRHPFPTHPAGAMALDPPHSEHLNLVR